MKDQRNERRGGFYWQKGKPYISVTKVLTCIDKPALRYWFGREVYRAFVIDPSLGETEALAMPYKLSDKAKDRGTTIHSIVEAYRHSKAYIDSVPEPYKPYAKAFYDWTEDNHVTILEHEKTVVNDEYGYGGTLDLLVSLNGSKKKLIIDVKTGKDIYPEAYLQLSAYKHCLADIDQIAVLLLQEDGNYKFAKGEDQFEVFLAVKKLWEWQNAELCRKVGYESNS